MHELQTIIRLKSQVSDEIEKARAKLKALEVVEKMIRDSKASNVITIQPKAYSNMKQEPALKLVLEAAGKKLSASEIAERMKQGGFKFRSGNPSNSLYVTMKKNAKGLYVSEKDGKRTVFGLAGQQTLAANSEG